MELIWGPLHPLWSLFLRCLSRTFYSPAAANVDYTGACGRKMWWDVTFVNNCIITKLYSGPPNALEIILQVFIWNSPKAISIYALNYGRPRDHWNLPLSKHAQMSDCMHLCQVRIASLRSLVCMCIPDRAKNIRHARPCSDKS